MERGEQVAVTLHDAQGRQVGVIHDGWLDGRTHQFDVEVRGLASGVYFVKATGESFAANDRFTLVQ